MTNVIAQAENAGLYKGLKQLAELISSYHRWKTQGGFYR